jgi:SPP1 family predicted phage head-tail adaptor
MQAGRLSERITIQQKTVSRDAFGAEVITWSDVATVWAEANPIAGREYVALRQAQSDISLRFRLRYLAGITTAMRVLWEGKNWNIVEAINVGARRVELELLCTGDAGDA